jgi:hypothetical protein
MKCVVAAALCSVLMFSPAFAGTLIELSAEASRSAANDQALGKIDRGVIAYAGAAV